MNASGTASAWPAACRWSTHPRHHTHGDSVQHARSRDRLTPQLASKGYPVPRTEEELRSLLDGATANRNGQHRPTNSVDTAPERLWRVQCPRHMWPTVHDAIRRAKAKLTTGTCNTTLELLLSDKGVKVARRFGLQPQGVGRDPWPGRLRAGDGVKRYRDAENAPPDDPLEAAFRREAARIRAARSVNP